jgi:hypothetical protein
MTQHDVPEPREPVDILLAVGIDEHRTAAANPHARRALHRNVVLRVNQDREITSNVIHGHGS